MAIIINGESIPVTITEMEAIFNPKSDRAINDAGLLKIYDLTNEAGKQNWLIVSKKYNRPLQVTAARGLSSLIKYAAIGAGVYIIYKIANKK